MPVFGQMKYDMGYKRFRHFGIDKVNMDFAFFAIAFNIKKLCAKMGGRGQNGSPEGSQQIYRRTFLIFMAHNTTQDEKIMKIGA